IFRWQDRTFAVQKANQFVFSRSVFAKNFRIDFYTDGKPDEIAHQKIYPAVPTPKVCEYGVPGSDNPRIRQVLYAGAEFGKVRGLSIAGIAEAADLAPVEVVCRELNGSAEIV